MNFSSILLDFGLTQVSVIDSEKRGGYYKSYTKEIAIPSKEVSSGVARMQKYLDEKHNSTMPSFSFCYTSNETAQETIFFHELAHAIEDEYRVDYVRERILICNMLDMYVSRYGRGPHHAMNSYSEAFAEAFALYMAIPMTLHNLSAEIYSACNEIYLYATS